MRLLTAVTAAALLVAACAAAPGTASPASPSPPSTVAPTPGSPADPTPEPILLPILPAPSGSSAVGVLVGGPSGVTALGAERGASESVPTLLAGTADGATWTAYRTDADVWSYLTTVADGPAGLLARAEPADTGVAFLLASGDHGATWTRGAPLAEADVATMVGGRDAYLLLGTIVGAAEPAATAWLSADGTSLGAPIALPPSGDPQGRALPDGFLVLDDGTSGSAPWLAVATAAGATRLAAAGVGLTAGTFLPAVVVVGDRLLVVRQDEAGATGWAAAAGGLHADAPFERVADLDGALVGASVVAGAANASGAVLLAFDRASLERFALTSPDGRAWTRHALPSDALGGGIERKLAATETGFVAVGRAVSAADAADTLWRSPDGATWELAPAPVGPPAVAPSGACPPPPATIAELGAMEAATAAACFSRKDLVLSASVGSCGGCGGTTPYTWIPDWLGGMYAPLYLASEDMTSASDGGGYPAWPDPARRLSIPPEGTAVVVTGHFDDPAAPSCRVVPTGAVVAALPPADEAVAACRRAFVVTAIEVRP